MSLGISVYFGLDNTMEENIKLLSEAKKKVLQEYLHLYTYQKQIMKY